ncbi:MAG: imidazole glycerol phosphate synthase subunit HisH [Vicinamibacterales bacterium]
MIAVVSYGVCNVGSILNMLRKVGAPAEAVSAPSGIERAEKLILPGIGAFDNGMNALTDRGLADPIRARARQNTPVLGICLGMQLLSEGSEEGVLSGLGLVKGRCLRFPVSADPQLRVPHMGWNVLSPRRESLLLNGLGRDARFYFVHSYHLACHEAADVLATAQYGVEFTAMVQRDNVWGAQFHPEKSHKYGMALLRNFASL